MFIDLRNQGVLGESRLGEKAVILWSLERTQKRSRALETVSPLVRLLPDC